MIISLLLTSCASVDARGHTIQHHFGYIKIDQGPRTDGRNVERASTVTLGLAVRGGGGTLGYDRLSTLRIPEACRVVMVIPPRWEVAQAAELARSMNLGEALCISEDIQ